MNENLSKTYLQIALDVQKVKFRNSAYTALQ
jgi:hypothetical protein